MFEASQYLIERRLWRNRKKDRLMIKSIAGNVLGYYGLDENVVPIMDVDGVTQGEVQRLSGWNYILAVFGPQHTLRGTVKQTGTGTRGGLISIPHNWVIMDPQGGLLATFNAIEKNRLSYLWQVKAPNGELVANVHHSSNKEFIQLDVTRPGFDPLLVLADIIYQIAAGGVPLVPM